LQLVEGLDHRHLIKDVSVQHQAEEVREPLQATGFAYISYIRTWRKW
jgi:hypothetical protein